MAQAITQEAIATVADLLGLPEEVLTQAISARQGAAPRYSTRWGAVPEVALCGQALFTKDGVCTAQATTPEGTCGKHTAAKRAAHVASVAQQEARTAQRDAFLSARETEVRAKVAAQGGLVILTKHNGTVTSRSRRDLSALGVRGLTKTSTVAEVVAKAEAHGLKVATQPALQSAE